MRGYRQSTLAPHAWSPNARAIIATERRTARLSTLVSRASGILLLQELPRRLSPASLVAALPQTVEQGLCFPQVAGIDPDRQAVVDGRQEPMPFIGAPLIVSRERRAIEQHLRGFTRESLAVGPRVGDGTSAGGSEPEQHVDVLEIRRSGVVAVSGDHLHRLLDVDGHRWREELGDVGRPGEFRLRTSGEAAPLCGHLIRPARVIAARR